MRITSAFFSLICLLVIGLCTGCNLAETVGRGVVSVGKGVGWLFTPTDGDAPIKQVTDTLSLFWPGIGVGGTILTGIVGLLGIKGVKKLKKRNERKFVEKVAKANTMISTSTP